MAASPATAIVLLVKPHDARAATRRGSGQRPGARGPPGRLQTRRVCVSAPLPFPFSEWHITAQHRFAQHVWRMARSFPVLEACLIAVKLQRRRTWPLPCQRTHEQYPFSLYLRSTPIRSDLQLSFSLEVSVTRERAARGSCRAAQNCYPKSDLWRCVLLLILVTPLQQKILYALPT